MNIELYSHDLAGKKRFEVRTYDFRSYVTFIFDFDHENTIKAIDAMYTRHCPDPDLEDGDTLAPESQLEMLLPHLAHKVALKLINGGDFKDLYLEGYSRLDGSDGIAIDDFDIPLFEAKDFYIGAMDDEKTEI